MAFTTKKLGLLNWVRSDKIKVDEINDNFNILDNAVVCVESGTFRTAYRDSSYCTWNYKKYSDGTCEAWASVLDDNVTWTQDEVTGLYVTDNFTLDLPVPDIMKVPIENFQICAAYPGRTIATAYRSGTTATSWTIRFATWAKVTNARVRAYIQLKGKWQ